MKILGQQREKIEAEDAGPGIGLQENQNSWNLYFTDVHLTGKLTLQVTSQFALTHWIQAPILALRAMTGTRT